MPDIPSTAAGESSEVAEGRLVTTDFVVCYRDNYTRLIRALRLAGAGPAMAEDVAQEAFARAFSRWRRVCRGPNPPGYVYVTAFRLLQRGHKRASREHSTARAVEPQDLVGGGDSTTALVVRAALEGMPPRRRACAVMCLVAGLSTREAAEALGIADGTVRKHLEEARAQLREVVNPA